jgi:O-acetyl-ADP-ribose deacetylase (regulator of RNase III)
VPIARADLRLVLVDPDAELCRQWSSELSRWDAAVTIKHGRFEDLERFDALVSPGNSFGVMDGGVDAHIVDRFPAVHSAVRMAIDERFAGYQPVGTALIVSTGDRAHPFLVHAPTMRVPMPLPPDSAVNVHDAFWGALLAVDRHNRSDPTEPIRILAFSGLGTGVGRIPAGTAARLMALAYASWREPRSTGPRAAFEREASLRQILGRA